MRPNVTASLVVDFGWLAEPHPVAGHLPGDRVYPNLYVYAGNFDGYVYRNEVVRYYLEVRAENYVPTELTVIEVFWNGEWSEDLDAMRQNLVVREIDPDDLTRRHRGPRSMTITSWPLM